MCSPTAVPSPLECWPGSLGSEVERCCDPREFLIDPGADAETILNATAGLDISAILLTHTHFDHVMAVPSW